MTFHWHPVWHAILLFWAGIGAFLGPRLLVLIMMEALSVPPGPGKLAAEYIVIVLLAAYAVYLALGTSFGLTVFVAAGLGIAFKVAADVSMYHPPNIKSPWWPGNWPRPQR